MKFLSVNNIVIPAAKTGKDNNNNIAVINIDQLYNGIFSLVSPSILIFVNVHIKFIAPNNDDIPAKCKLNIAASTDRPVCDCKLDNGGYNVHPVPDPNSINVDKTNNINEAGNNQKLKLFNLFLIRN